MYPKSGREEGKEKGGKGKENGKEKAMDDFLAVTLWFPPARKESRCRQLLSKWAYEMRKGEDMSLAYFGGIFTNFYPQAQSHAHVVLTGLNKRTGKTIKDIDLERWRALWKELTAIPAFKAANIKQGENLTGWLNYIFKTNVNKADDWRTLYFNLNQLNRFTDIKAYLKGFKNGK